MPERLYPDDPPAIGPYELMGRLGAGGQGVVYLGRTRDERYVAVKVLHGAVSDQVRERFEGTVRRPAGRAVLRRPGPRRLPRRPATVHRHRVRRGVLAAAGRDPPRPGAPPGGGLDRDRPRSRAPGRDRAPRLQTG